MTGAFSPISASFIPVAGEEKWTFADYKVNCDEDDPESQTGWIANNDSFNTYTPEGGFDKAFIYCPAWLSAALTEAFQYDVPVGWYDQEDQEFTKCYNTERKFVAGEGFVAKASTPTATVTIKSALAKDDE